MNYFCERIREKLAQAGLNPYSLSRLLNEDAALVNRVVNGKRSPSDRLLGKIAGVVDLNVTLSDLKKWRAYDKFQDLKLPIATLEGFYRFPCLGSVSAGSLQTFEKTEDVSYYEWIDVKEYSPDLFCLRVKGDSMAPIIPDGAIILVKPSKTFTAGGIYVVETENGKTTVKLVRSGVNGAILHPFNSKYDPIAISTITRAWQVLEYKVSFV